jgi:calcium binding protein 39
VCYALQSLRLLYDILLEKRNVHVMFQYVKSKRQLMLVMNLLRSSSTSIQYEAFHVFKVFVANPKKPRDIRGILIANREKLLRFLTGLLVERGVSSCKHPHAISSGSHSIYICSQ